MLSYPHISAHVFFYAEEYAHKLDFLFAMPRYSLMLGRRACNTVRIIYHTVVRTQRVSTTLATQLSSHLYKTATVNLSTDVSEYFRASCKQHITDHYFQSDTTIIKPSTTSSHPRPRHRGRRHLQQQHHRFPIYQQNHPTKGFCQR